MEVVPCLSDVREACPTCSASGEIPKAQSQFVSHVQTSKGSCALQSSTGPGSVPLPVLVTASLWELTVLP